MEGRSIQADPRQLNQATAPAAIPASAAKVTLDIDLDETVALELTEAEKTRYRSTKDYANRRAFVASLKDDTDNDNVKEKKTKKQKQRELFAKKEGDYTTPVVILILLDIQDTLNAHVTNLAKTDLQKAAEFNATIEIIKVTLSIFVKSDTIMQGWFLSKTSYLGELRNRAKAKSAKSGVPVHMFQHLNQLVKLVDDVKITLDMVPLMRELGLWLLGIYLNDLLQLVPEGKVDEATDEPIKELDDKGQLVFPFVNMKDSTICYGQYGFRLLDVTFNHYLVYKKIEEKCRACELANGIAPVVEPVVAAVPVKVEKKSEDFSVRLVKSSKEGMTDIVVRINTANFPDKSIATIKRALISMFKNPLGALLSYRVSAPLHLRIREFAERLAVFELSAEMRSTLAGTKASALKVLQEYKEKKSSFLNNVVWAASFGTLDNKNFKLVEAARKTIQANDEYEEIIKAMTILRQSTELNGSTHIADAVTKFLQNQIEIIRTSEAATGPGMEFPEPTVMTDVKDRNIQILVFNMPNKHCEVAETICNVFHSFVANQIGFALAQCNLTDEDERILFFKKKITDCGFTVVQEAEYSVFYERTKEVVLEYIDPNNLRYVNLAHYFKRGTLPRFLEKYLEKTHAKDADGLLRILTDPQLPLTEKILNTIEIYEKVKDKFSTTLGPALKKFLLDYMSWLTPFIPRERAVSQPRLEQRSSSLGMK